MLWGSFPLAFYFTCGTVYMWGFPGGSGSEESACNAGICLPCRRPRFSLWIGKIPGRFAWGSQGSGDIGYPLQYSYLENSMGRWAWWAAADHKESNMTRQLTHTQSVYVSGTFSFHPSLSFPDPSIRNSVLYVWGSIPNIIIMISKYHYSLVQKL